MDILLQYQTILAGYQPIVPKSRPPLVMYRGLYYLQLDLAVVLFSKILYLKVEKFVIYTKSSPRNPKLDESALGSVN